MTQLSSRWLVLPAAIVAVTAILFAEPKDGSISTNDFERSAASSDPAEREEVRRLNARGEMFALRISYKEALIQHLIEGKATLDAIAAEFLRLNRDTPISLNVIAGQYPGFSEVEASALNVLGYIQTRVTADNRQAVLGRLNAEFRNRFGRDAESGY